MYGMVTQHSKVEIRGRRLPRFTYKVNKKTKEVTLRRIAWLFIRLYRHLPERPTPGPKGMATTKSAQQKRIEFAMRANRLMKEQGWRPDADTRQLIRDSGWDDNEAEQSSTSK